MISTLSKLIGRLLDRRLLDAQVIPWGSPVPAFGDATSADIATLGLNPSNREFVDSSGVELDGGFRRFHTLGSLRIASWAHATAQHERLIWESCRFYFRRNPYDGWFRQLDALLSETDASYYGTS